MTYTRVRDYRSTKALWSDVLQFTFYVTTIGKDISGRVTHYRVQRLPNSISMVTNLAGQNTTCCKDVHVEVQFQPLAVPYHLY